MTGQHANSFISNVLVIVFVLAALACWAVTSWQRHHESSDDTFARCHRIPQRTHQTRTAGAEVPPPHRVPQRSVGRPSSPQ